MEPRATFPDTYAMCFIPVWIIIQKSQELGAVNFIDNMPFNVDDNNRHDFSFGCEDHIVRFINIKRQLIRV